MCYERIEKNIEARRDFISVKELDPMNKQASEGLSRVLKQLSPNEIKRE